jgi:hypothetical protein
MLLGLVATPAGPAVSPFVFGPGEQSTYTIHYLGVTGGGVEITVGAPLQQWGKEVWPIVAVAKTDPRISFFPVRDKFVTYWDPRIDWSLGSELMADENHHRHRMRIRMHREELTATVIKQREGEEESESSLQFPSGAVDITAAMFTLRKYPLSVGKQLDLPVFTGNHTFTLHAVVEAQQALKTLSGPKDAFRLRIQTGFGGKFASKGDLVGYVSTDPAHVPLRLEAEFVLGTLVAELIDYKPGVEMHDRMGAGGSGDGR